MVTVAVCKGCLELEGRCKCSNQELALLQESDMSVAVAEKLNLDFERNPCIDDLFNLPAEKVLPLGNGLVEVTFSVHYKLFSSLLIKDQ